MHVIYCACLIGWLIIGLSIIIGAIFMTGYKNDLTSDGYPDNGDLIEQAILTAVLLPVFLLTVIGVSPFYGIYRLGKYFGNK